MVEAQASPEFSIPVDPAKLDRAGEMIELAPTAEQCAAIAQRLGLQALSRLSGSVDIRPWGAGGYEVSGKLHAAVTQECVVSLEPIDNVIEDTFLVRYLPPKALASYLQEEEVMVGDIEEDPPEPLSADGFDVGELAVEYLSLAIDPYPRGKDADKSHQFGDEVEPDVEKPNPFSILSDLKS